MFDRVFCSVEAIAKTVIGLTDPGYLRKPSAILSLDLCQTTITEGNIDQTIERIKFLRQKKVDAFARMIGWGIDWGSNLKKRRKMQKIVDSPSDELNSMQKSLRREIRFLSNIIRSVYELKFIKE